MTNERTTPKRRKRGIVRAVLAGGLVLGVGAAVTLASWESSEYATSTFTAGALGLEGSTTGDTGSFSTDATADDALALPFDGADALTPDDMVQTPFAIRLTSGTTDDATVTLASTPGTGSDVADFAGLSYSVYQTDDFGCDALGDAVEIVTDATLGAGDTDASITLDKPAADAAGAQVNLCIQVNAGADLAPAQTGAVTWNFHATSADDDE